MEAQQQFAGSAEWSALLQRAEAERHNDNEVREALIGVLARVVDEYRWGLRDINLDELGDLVDIWCDLNRGETPAEVAMRLITGTRI